MISQEEIWQKVGQITLAYPIYECDKCAIAIVQWLTAEGVNGTFLCLRTANCRDSFITSNRHRGNESITLNGKHYGVEIMGRVFDNISEAGLTREDWLSDFSCRSNRFIIEEVSLPSLLSFEDEL